MEEFNFDCRIKNIFLDVWHFFAEYIYILANNVWQFQIEFFGISTVEE
jgi:hypothetical protein